MTDDGIGVPLRRKEDLRFLTGNGRYSGDRREWGELVAVFRRSDESAGRILSIDTAAARELPGVVAVWTAQDLPGGGLPGVGARVAYRRADGSPTPELLRPILAADRVRMAGDALAIVVAESEAAARDGAEAIEIDIEAMPAVGTIAAACAEGAPAVWENCPDNRAYVWAGRDGAAVARALDEAAHVVELDLTNCRITANPMEPRCCLAVPEADGKLRLVMGNQAPHLLRTRLAPLLAMAETDITIVSEDMGGGFGMRVTPYSEEVAVSRAALALQRPVRWTGTRSECVITDTGARSHETTARLALDADGRITGLAVTTRAEMGAYLTGFGPGVPVELYAPLIPGVYRLPALSVTVEGVLTNTAPTAPYRGAGRPEAIYVMERIMDAAAAQTGIDRAELRRRNLITREEAPYTTVTGLAYEAIDFPGLLDDALAMVDREGFEARRAEAVRRGKLRGLGLSMFVETSAMPGPTVFETAQVRVHPTGDVEVGVGTHSHGQGHATVFAQILGQRLGLPTSRIEVVYGDTSRAPYGQGTYASRSTVLAGPAITIAADKVIAKGRRIAAHLLEAAVEDVAFEAGSYRIAGTDREVSWGEVAMAAYVPHNFPHHELEPGLEERAFYHPEGGTFPSGCHIAEVEVDPETGVWHVLDYAGVDDVGTVINPLLLDGQMHGGIAQGLGQARLEHCVYDPETAQPLAASFLDYAMPRADDMPPIRRVDRPMPSGSNVLGVKGAGELGTVGATPTVMSALLDALAPAGVTAIDMPATPQAVWRALQAARRQQQT
jgi:aerobic carbon-monoxide dehydrogenase large subunit